MNRLFICGIAAALTLQSAPLGAQSPPPVGDGARTPVTLADAHVFTVRDTATSTAYRVYVALPAGYAASSRRYPVLYMLDADAGFALATQAYRLLRVDTTMVELLLVGIGYEPSGPGRRSPRMRDFTPTRMASIPGSGEGAAFLNSLASNIIPAIDSLYRTDSGDRAIFGHSLGGLFALYALMERPDVFRRYIISSPALWWDNGVIMSLESRLARSRTTLPKSVFMSVGSAESPDMHQWFQPLADSLRSRGYRDLALTATVLAHEDHLSAFPASLVRGMRSVFR